MLLSHSPTGGDTISQLLSAWVEAVLRYDEFMGEDVGVGRDCCWWYNERTNVSALAGAAWSKGWVALEEYSTRKRLGAPKQGVAGEPAKTDSHGRVDLYVSTREEDYAFEAKQVWLRLDLSPDEAGYGTKAVDDGMRAARIDAQKLFGEAGTHIAATFIVPFLPAGDVPKEVSADFPESLCNWLSKLSDYIQNNSGSNGPMQLAYVFPRLDERCYVNAAGYYYPGVVLVAETLQE